MVVSALKFRTLEEEVPLDSKFYRHSLLCFNEHRLYDFCRTLHLHGWPSWDGGHLLEAENFINAMPCKPHAAMWKTLLGTCIIHSNVEMGEHIAKHVLELEPENAAVYLLLSRIYAVVGNRHPCDNVEHQRKEKGVRKNLGCTWIEVNNEVHTFVVDDWDHPQMIKIHAEL